MKQILMIMFLFLYTFLNATIINVPTDQTTIQAAINVAVNGDTILVMPGTYVENISFNGKLITVGSLFLTTQDTTYISSTIIDGNSSGSVVIFNNSENSASILVGFTIKNGNSTWGGGIHCEEASPSLNNLYIVNNYADYGGGILCNVNADITLSHLTIAGNNADVGGGIYCYQSNPTLEKVLLSSNTATIFGGGLFCYDNANFNIENVTMTNNSAGTSGGAIYCSDSYPDLVNSILWDNIPEEIFLTSGGTVTATYSDIEGGLTGTGNIDEDPLFVNPGNGDYHLQPTSPCIDAGDPASPLDIDGTVVEMGAYYFNSYNGPIWHVSTTGSDLTGNGTEQFPFSTIQHGIDVSADSDTVLVQPGTYEENINYNGKLITVASLFLTTLDTIYISQTIIGGETLESVVTFENGEDSTSVLTGLIITGNSQVEYGGGIYCKDSSPSLENVTIKVNSATYGGGIYCEDSSPSLENVILAGNASLVYGGGIYCEGSSPSLENVQITNNFSFDLGGGIFCYNGSDPTLKNITLSDNSAANNGGGIYCVSGAHPTLINSILLNNFPQEIFLNLWGSVTVNYTNIEGGWTGTGNIDSDPLFVDPDNGDYHLQRFSPCIDTGDPVSPLDPDGTNSDMGAHYYDQILNPFPPIVDFISDFINGYSPATINFTDTSEQGSLAINEWYWDFGDGNNSSLQDPAHEYTLPGIYTVSLTVIDDNDSTDIETKIDYITVFGNDPPAATANVQITISEDNAVINWDAVNTTIYSDPIQPDGYIVLNYQDPYSEFTFLSFTPTTTYTHSYVGQYIDKMFYKIITVVDMSREGIEYLKSLNNSHNKVKWTEVKRNIYEKRK